MAQPRLRRCETTRDFERTIDDLAVQGYEIVDRGEHSTLMREKSWGTTGGHVLWAFLTLWWTFGLGNVAYALIKHFGAPKVLVKLDDEQPARNQISAAA